MSCFSPYRVILCAYVLAVLLLAPARAQQAAPEEAYEDVPTFKLEVVEKKFLPPAMYGTWSIKAKVLRSDAPPWLFHTESQELWALSRDGDTVILHNVVTNASAQVTVDEVHGNTATFHHTAESPNSRLRFLEIPTITVIGDRISGINIQKVTMKQTLGPPRTYNLEISLEGTRLTGARMRFDGYQEEEPEFVVEPLRFED